MQFDSDAQDDAALALLLYSHSRTMHGVIRDIYTPHVLHILYKNCRMYGRAVQRVAARRGPLSDAYVSSRDARTP